jgi:hypothetical protein
MPLPESCCSTHLQLGIKDPLKEEEGFLPLAFAFCFGAFLVWEAFRMEKIAKGEWLKRG